MKISLNNAVLATSEYLSRTFTNIGPDWSTAIMAMFAHYKLNSQGIEMLKILSDNDGYINLDILEQGIKTYMSGLKDQTFKTMVGDIKIGAETPYELLEHLKRYGEN